MPSTTVKVTNNHKLRFEWSQGSQSTSGNYSNVNWALYVDTDAYGAIPLGGSQAWSVTIEGEEAGSGADSGGFAKNESKLLGSGTHRVYHNSDGSKTFSFSFKKLFGFTWGDTYRGEYSGNGSGTLTTIPRASGLSVSDGTLGTAQTITADRKSSSFTHTLTWSCSGESGTICTLSSATSWQFTPSLDLASHVPSGTSVQMTFTLSTYSGSTLVGSTSKTVTMSVPTTVVPICDMTIEDLTTHFAELGKYLQRQSKLKIHVVARGAYGSNITSMKVTADGVVYNCTLPTASFNAEHDFETDVLQNTGTQPVTAVVNDSRGRSTTIRMNIEVQSYDAPRITQLVVHRCNEDGTENQSGMYAKVTYSYIVSSASSGNPVLRYKKSQDTTYTEIVLPGGQSADNAYKIFPADDGSPYDIELVITDSYGSASRKTSLSTGYAIMHFPASGYGITFGGVATKSGFNVNMLARFNRGILYKPRVLNSGNCDELLESGVYFIGIYGQNRPASNNIGWLVVMSINDGLYCVQQYITVDYQMWIRYRVDGTWKPWSNIFIYTEGLSEVSEE